MMVGTVTLMTGGLYCPPSSLVPVTVVVQNTITGQIVEPDTVLGQIIEPARVVGMIRTCPGGDDMTELNMVRGDSADFPFVVLDDPATLGVVWTWDGTLTVLSSDTSTIIVGDWIRLSSSSPWFKVTAINPNVDATIENPDSLTVPTGIGADGASPVDLTGGVVRASAQNAWTSLSYDDPDGVELTDPAAGEGVWHITPQDQVNVDPGDFCWDIETNRRGTLRSNSGTVTPTSGSLLLEFTVATVATVAQVGDILVGTGAGLPANQVSILVTGTPDTDDTIPTGHVRTDYDGLQTEAAYAFDLYRGIRKTPEGLTGSLALQQDSTVS